MPVPEPVTCHGADTFRSDPGRGHPDVRATAPVWWHELGYVAGFYLLYSATRDLFGSGAVHAFHNAQRMIRVETWLGIFHEATVQSWFLGLPWFVRLLDDFYGTFHFVATIAVLVVTFRRWPGAYRFWRNVLALTTSLALIGFSLFPLMPPRLLCDCVPGAGRGVNYGFVDTLERFGGLWSFDSATVKSISNQYAAMPSLHLAWALWCTAVLVPRLRHRWSKALAIAYPLFTMFAITVTANHYFLDAVAGLLTLAAGYGCARLVERLGPFTLGAGAFPESPVEPVRPPEPVPPAASHREPPGEGQGVRLAPVILERINAPSDLRALTDEELETLAIEIRQFIVDSVDQAGSGHLGSNLGVVELTLALHRVFDSPQDMILWDTGHQAYVHKIVTGRRDRFSTLRQAEGLSGYPSRAESEHDWVENSHASTILSYAFGLSTAEASEGGHRRRVVAVIGDGSMTGGMAFEGLNNLGHSGRDCIIVLNDNGRSYAPTVSRLGESLARIRNNPVYMRRQARLERLLQEIPMVGERLERGLEATKAAIREMWEPTAFFETLGVRYTGPFDGHDIRGLEEALRNAAQISGPQVVHVLTQKGRGYGPAETDTVKHLHDLGQPKPDSYTAAFTEALIKEAGSRPEIVAITAAMPDSTGLLPFAEQYPDRCFDVGIAEQHAVTAAAGMAMGGLRPVVAVYSTFLTRAFDQVNLDVGLHRQPVIFCLDRAGVTGADGPSHHGVLDMMLLTKVPGMTVLAPSSYQELQQMFHDALDMCDGPVALRWPGSVARQESLDAIGSGLKGRRLRQGHDLCIISVGKMLDAAEQAADHLAGDGFSVTLWDARVAKPLDPEMLADAASHPCVLTVEDGVREGGVGSAIADQLAEHTLGEHEPRVRVLGTPVSYLAHDRAETILAELGLDRDGIVASAASLLAGDHIPRT